MNAQEKADLIKLLDTELKDFDISQRTIRVTRESEIFTLGQLVQHKIEDLLKYKNLKSKVFQELEKLVNSKNLNFNYNINNMKSTEEIIDQVQSIAEKIFSYEGTYKVYAQSHFGNFISISIFTDHEYLFSPIMVKMFHHGLNEFLNFNTGWESVLIFPNINGKLELKFKYENSDKLSENE